MSTSIQSKVVKAGLVLSMVAAGFGAQAKQMNLNEFLGYTVKAQVHQAQVTMLNEIEQEIFDAAFASLKQDAALPNTRPAVTIREVELTEDEE